MDSVGGGRSESDRRALAEEYPGWRIWRNAGLFYAWRLNTSPPVVLRDTNVADLRAQIRAYLNGR
jgi:hypothetical protein